MRELAYNEVKRRTVAYEFRPGEPLNEVQLGVLLGPGRMPIHQTLHRLGVEGLIQILPCKGVLVTPLSPNDVLDMIEVRATNEILRVTLTAECVHPTDFDAMRAIIDASPVPVEHCNIAALAVLDLKFHLAISAALRNHVLAELLRGLHERQTHFWFLSLSEPQHLQNVYDRHLAVLGVLERRDVSAIHETTHEHIDEFHRTIVHTL